MRNGARVAPIELEIDGARCERYRDVVATKARTEGSGSNRLCARR